MPDITLAMATGIMKGPFYKSDLTTQAQVTGIGWFSNFLLYGDGEAPTEFTKKQIQWSAAGESSGVVLSTDDATALQKFKTFLPATHEASHNVHRMLLIAKAIFPPKRAFLRHLSELESQWQNHYQTIKNCVLSNSTMDNSKGIIILEAFTFTIKTNFYWQQLDSGSANATLESPLILFNKMKYRAPWVPQLTPLYVASLGLQQFNGVTGDFWLENLLVDGSAGVQRADAVGVATSWRLEELPLALAVVAPN